MKRSSKLEPECNSGIRNARETRTLKGSIQLQAGLGRPAIYKKRAEVDAALGLRDLGRRTIYKKETEVDAALGLRDLSRRTIYKKETEVDAALGLRTVTYVASGSRSTWAAYPCALKRQFNSAQWQRPGST
ncbi:MAG: hypothetical protein R6U62_01105 [Bacteroidales bacterium]